MRLGSTISSAIGLAYNIRRIHRNTYYGQPSLMSSTLEETLRHQRLRAPLASPLASIEPADDKVRS